MKHKWIQTMSLHQARQARRDMHLVAADPEATPQDRASALRLAQMIERHICALKRACKEVEREN